MTKRDILDTEAMLDRLANLLHANLLPGTPINGQARTDAESLRKISMTLHRWHELECGDSNAYGSWAIARGRKVHVTRPAASTPHTVFEHDDDGAPYMEHHHWAHGKGKDTVTYTKIADREAGAKRRLARIMVRYPSLTAYIQTDPRGCALYILRADDVPAGSTIDSCYSRGLAVFK